MLASTQAITPFLPHEKALEILGRPGVLEFERHMLVHMLRDAYIRAYGFPYVTQETLAALSSIIGTSKTLDAGSGTGFLSLGLAKSNPQADIVAADFPESRYGFSGVVRRDYSGDALALLPGGFQFVILSWPNYESDFAFKVARAMKSGQILVYQGESEGGCTANHKFFELLHSRESGKSGWSHLPAQTEQLNKFHLRFPSIHDDWQVWRKH